MYVVQHSTIPRAPLDRACSAAHNASRGRVGDAIARRLRSIPQAAQAGALSSCGGATSKDQRSSSPNFPSAGIKRAHSPNPVLSTRISVSVPRGQPPPGNSASSVGKPLETAGTGVLAKRLAHQISGRASTSLSETAAFIAFLFLMAGRSKKTRFRDI